MFEEENAKEIIDNLLSASPAVLASEDVMQQRGTRDRKPTGEGTVNEHFHAPTKERRRI